MSTSETNLSDQLDELEALSAIYEGSIVVRENNACEISIGEGNAKVVLHVNMPEGYPRVRESQ